MGRQRRGALSELGAGSQRRGSRVSLVWAETEERGALSEPGAGRQRRGALSEPGV